MDYEYPQSHRRNFSEYQVDNGFRRLQCNWQIQVNRSWAFCEHWSDAHSQLTKNRNSLTSRTLHKMFSGLLRLWVCWLNYCQLKIFRQMQRHAKTQNLVALLFGSEKRVVIPLTPNDPYRGRTPPLTSKRCILYIYSTNIDIEYFKYVIDSPFFSLKNAVCFIILSYLVPVLFTFYVQGVLKLKK